MKIVLALFPSIFALPRIFRNSNANGNLMPNFGVRQPNPARSVGMTDVGIADVLSTAEIAGRFSRRTPTKSIGPDFESIFQQRNALTG